MKIYHYKSIEALSQILENKTIRFNRLDHVDDLEEGRTEAAGIKFCKYIFVSCWTESDEESIAMWKLYGGNAGGVRIGLPQKMFKEYLIHDLHLPNGLSSFGSIVLPIPPEDLVNPDFFICPLFDYNNGVFYRRVQYVDDINKYFKNLVYLKPEGNNLYSVFCDMQNLAKYKNKCWKFQEESRFVIYIFPYNGFVNSNNPNLNYEILSALLGNRPLGFSFYDMHLNKMAIENIEITLGPSITEEKSKAVYYLAEKFAPKAIIKKSSFTGKINLK